MIKKKLKKRNTNLMNSSKTTSIEESDIEKTIMEEIEVKKQKILENVVDFQDISSDITSNLEPCSESQSSDSFILENSPSKIVDCQNEVLKIFKPIFPKKDEEKQNLRKGEERSNYWESKGGPFKKNLDFETTKLVTCNICKNSNVIYKHWNDHLKKCNFEIWRFLNSGPSNNIDCKLTLYERFLYVCDMLKFLIEKAMPLSFASGESWIRSQQRLNSNVVGIGKNTFKKYLEKIVPIIKNIIKEKIQKEINKNTFLCFCADLWQSLCKDEYLWVSMTYLPNLEKRITLILDIIHINNIHITNESLINSYE